MKNETKAKAEVALMGAVVRTNSDQEVRDLTEYILNVMGAENLKSLDVLKFRIRKYTEDNTVYGLCTNRVMGMPCITYLIDTHDGETPAPLEEDYGTGYPCSFCYVLNLSADEMCSEFGDCFFEKRGDLYFRKS